MSEHLPECPMLKPCCDDEQFPEHGFCGNFSGRCLHCMAECICDELRACKERVKESIDRAWEQAAQLAVAHARTATLDAAREAVAALDAYYAIEECQGNPLEKGDPEDPDPWHQGHLIERDDALAAIDALKEKP